jgi:L-threonylcarbamoyladenylate synthase
MLVRKIDPLTPDEETLQYAAKLIRGGGVVVFPSDSSYGLAANPSDKAALKRLFKIKQRPDDRQVSCVFRDISQIEQWSHINKAQLRTLERNLPGPFTFLLQPRVAYPIEGMSVGVRIPDNSLTKALSYVLDQPYTATSANLSGWEPAYSLQDILQLFEGQIYQPDLILDVGKLPQYPPSAVVDIRGPRPKIIREGVAKVC